MRASDKLWHILSKEYYASNNRDAFKKFISILCINNVRPEFLLQKKDSKANLCLGSILAIEILEHFFFHLGASLFIKCSIISI